MLEHKLKGEVVFVSSVMALTGFAGYTAYAGSKWAVRGTWDTMSGAASRPLGHSLARAAIGRAHLQIAPRRPGGLAPKRARGLGHPRLPLYARQHRHARLQNRGSAQSTPHPCAPFDVPLTRTLP